MAEVIYLSSQIAISTLISLSMNGEFETSVNVMRFFIIGLLFFF